jgi:hypothetical protein
MREFVALSFGLAAIAPCFLAACGSDDNGGGSEIDSGAETSLEDSAAPIDGTGSGTDSSTGVDAGSDGGGNGDASGGADASDAGSASDSSDAQGVSDASDGAIQEAGPDTGSIVITIDF